MCNQPKGFFQCTVRDDSQSRMTIENRVDDAVGRSSSPHHQHSLVLDHETEILLKIRNQSNAIGVMTHKQVALGFNGVYCLGIKCITGTCTNEVPRLPLERQGDIEPLA